LQIAQHALRGNAREEPGDAPPHEVHHEQGSRSAHIGRALAFEVPIELFVMVFPTSGIREFITREGRDERRTLSRNFWQRSGV